MEKFKKIVYIIAGIAFAISVVIMPLCSVHAVAEESSAPSSAGSSSASTEEPTTSQETSSGVTETTNIAPPTAPQLSSLSNIGTVQPTETLPTQTESTTQALPSETQTVTQASVPYTDYNPNTGWLNPTETQSVQTQAPTKTAHLPTVTVQPTPVPTTTAAPLNYRIIITANYFAGYIYYIDGLTNDQSAIVAETNITLIQQNLQKFTKKYSRNKLMALDIRCMDIYGNYTVPEGGCIIELPIPGSWQGQRNSVKLLVDTGNEIEVVYTWITYREGMYYIAFVPSYYSAAYAVFLDTEDPVIPNNNSGSTNAPRQNDGVSVIINRSLEARQGEFVDLRNLYGYPILQNQQPQVVQVEVGGATQAVVVNDDSDDDDGDSPEENNNAFVPPMDNNGGGGANISPMQYNNVGNPPDNAGYNANYMVAGNVNLLDETPQTGIMDNTLLILAGFLMSLGVGVLTLSKNKAKV